MPTLTVASIRGSSRLIMTQLDKARNADDEMVLAKVPTTLHPFASAVTGGKATMPMDDVRAAVEKAETVLADQDSVTLLGPDAMKRVLGQGGRGDWKLDAHEVAAAGRKNPLSIRYPEAREAALALGRVDGAQAEAATEALKKKADVLLDKARRASDAGDWITSGQLCRELRTLTENDAAASNYVSYAIEHDRLDVRPDRVTIDHR